MEKTKNYEALTIRIPAHLARDLRKLKEEEDLPSFGAALQVFIQNMIIEKLDKRLRLVDEKLRELANWRVDAEAHMAITFAALGPIYDIYLPGELTEDQRKKIASGKSPMFVELFVNALKRRKQHYADTGQKGHPSYKESLEMLVLLKEITGKDPIDPGHIKSPGKESPTDEHIT